MRNTLLLIGVAGILFCHSCSTCSRQQPVDDLIDLGDWFVDSAHVEMARKVLYALPTPIELSFLIREAGIPWNSDLLNDPARASSYLTSQKMALNFGVYFTNMAYAGLFEQTQTVWLYKFALNNLIERMGLQAAININTMQQLEENIHDREMLLRTISGIYADCSAFLDENERYSMTLAVLAGGWVECMHIATSMLDENLLANEDRIKQLVTDQILTFDIMWQAMSDLRESPGVEDLMNSFSGLAQLFDRIGIHQEPNTVSIFDDEDVSEISSTNALIVTPKDFENIKIQIQILRDNFTNN